MGNPEQSIPYLKQAFESTDNLDTRINFARILAVLGDPSGREVLLNAVNNAPDWGAGWDFSSQREKDNSFGLVDRLVIALGFLRMPEVLPPLIHKLEMLQANSSLSHYKAVCLALRLNKHELLAEPLAHLLNKPGVKGSRPASELLYRQRWSRARPATAAFPGKCTRWLGTERQV